MDFYLARHGEAVGELIDPTRPLTGAGWENVERVARLAAEKTQRVSVIYHSGILRAVQTAEILARHLAPLEGIQMVSGLLPDDDPSVIAAELAIATKPVMLVGHLPHLNRLASLLSRAHAERETVEFMPASLACYTREASRWKLNWMMTP
jgi:phosphohistidine phosphatase